MQTNIHPPLFNFFFLNYNIIIISHSYHLGIIVYNKVLSQQFYYTDKLITGIKENVALPQ